MIYVSIKTIKPWLSSYAKLIDSLLEPRTWPYSFTCEEESAAAKRVYVLLGAGQVHCSRSCR